MAADLQQTMPDVPLLIADTSPFPRRVFRSTAVVLSVVAVFFLLYVFRAVVFLLFVAIVLATALKPLVSHLERRGSSRPAAVSFVYTAISAVLVMATVIAGPLLLDQVQSAATSLPAGYERFREGLSEIPVALVQRVATHLPVASVAETSPDDVADQAITAVTQTLAYVGLGLRGVLAVLAVLLLAFYWALQEERSIRWFLLLFPAGRRDGAKDLIAAIQTKVGGYVRGQAVLCGAVGALALVAYLVIGLPYVVLLAALAGVLEAVPYFGPVLGAILPLVVTLSTDPSKAIWVVVASIAIQQAENYLLVPRVMNRSVGVHSLVTLLAIAGFGSLMGVPGAVLAIPLAAIIQTFIERSLLGPGAATPPEPPGRDAANLLRYELQELIRDVRSREREKEELATRGADRIEDSIESIARDLELGLEQLAAPNGVKGGAGSTFTETDRPAAEVGR